MLILHDLQRDLIRKRCEKNLPGLHLRLVEGWDAFPKLPDAYAWLWMAYHLVQSGRKDDLRQLLLNFDWLQAKLEATDPNAVIADYDYLLDDEELRLIQSAIRLSANVLARDARQLAGQLIGRLLGKRTPSIQALVNQAAEWIAWPWLRPLTPNLTEAGGALIRTLEGHAHGVRALALTPDGRRGVSGSRDQTLRLWDLESGQTIRTLEGHVQAVRALAVMPDGFRAVSGSEDGTLRLWDLESGQTIRMLEGHAQAVSAVAVTRDGRRVVSASRDRTLRLWDLESGKEIASFTGEDRMFSCAIAPNGMTIIAGDQSGRVHFLQLVEADPTKPAIGETKIQLLIQQQSDKSEKPREPSIPMLPTQTRAVFISYAHADNESPNRKERWLDRFVEFLKPLVRQEDFTLCSDQDIKIGQNWHQHIQAHLGGAKAVVLLISPAFLASDYIANSELPVILKNAADKGVRIFPILISPSAFKRVKYKYPDPKSGPQEFTLSSLQAANTPSETLIEMTEGQQNRILERVVDQLAELLSENP